jgi:hypothetical protein
MGQHSAFSVRKLFFHLFLSRLGMQLLQLLASLLLVLVYMPLCGLRCVVLVRLDGV